jgi:phosphate-selective porin
MRHFAVILAVLAMLGLVMTAPASAATCTADDIAKAVDDVGAKLRSFNSETMTALGPKLKQLQAARGPTRSWRPRPMRWCRAPK